MPKKKKASSLQRPTLQFAPSPDEQQPPVLTPEFAVHNPITAKSVQVNDQSLNTWVSPQFRFNAELKKRRSRHLSHVTQSSHKSKSFNETRATRERNRRYKQLQFINEAENTMDIDNKQTHSKDNKKSRKSKSKDRKFNSDKSVNSSNTERDFGEMNTPELQVNGYDEDNLSKTKVDLDEHSGTKTIKTCELVVDKDHTQPGNSSLCSAIGCQNNNGEHCRLSDVQLVNSTLTPSKHRPKPALLAPDTPEVEYGLPLRQIQLKYGLGYRV